MALEKMEKEELERRVRELLKEAEESGEREDGAL